MAVHWYFERTGIDAHMNCLRVTLAGLIHFVYSDRVSVARAERAGLRNHDGDYVVLIHGLGRTAFSMKRVEWALAKENYRVLNLSYPSTRLSIEDAAEGWLGDILTERTPDRTVKIHFVTHSLGGLVLRQYLSDQKIENLGRVVMLAPPNQGSELADKRKDNVLYKLFTGPSGQQLGTDEFGLPKRLGPADFELGVIAGDRSLNPWFSACIPGPDDGKVSVQSAQMEGMKNFLLVHHSHTWMTWRKNVIVSISQFLKSGRFVTERPFPSSD